MKAVVLAAGEGRRLLPLTADRPKPMVDVSGKPLLEHTLYWLKAYGITEIAINLHYRAEVISNYFETGRKVGVSLTYSLESEILGTGGALRRLESFLDSPFLVVYGDVLTDLDLDRLCRFHESKRRAGGIATLSLYRVPNPSDCGIVELDRAGRIVRLVEKPKPENAFSDLAFSGVLVAEPEFVQSIPRDAFCDLGYHTLPLLLGRGDPVFGLPISSSEYLVDIGSHDKYALACREWPLRFAALSGGASYADRTRTVSY